MKVPFSRPVLAGGELDNIRQVISTLRLSGNGPFTERCQEWLLREVGGHRALLTTSCTSALELAATLYGIGPGDEVIMPSFTFVSTASAFALCRAVPVFVDIREDTLNLDENLLEAAITPRTRAVVPVHYAGVACEMGAILDIAAAHGLAVIEDAAHCLGAEYRAAPLGSFGDVAAFSFHETKNVTCGEGGALLINRPDLVERAEIIWDKGTNRKQFDLGAVDEYTWVDIGSTYYPGEIVAAFLWAQLQVAGAIRTQRLAIWGRYHEAFAGLEAEGVARRPRVPEHCTHNAHAYFLLLPDRGRRDRLLEHLRRDGIHAVFHYVPLHSSPAGRRLGRAHGALEVTDATSERLLRLPLWSGMQEAEVDAVIEAVAAAVGA